MKAGRESEIFILIHVSKFRTRTDFITRVIILKTFVSILNSKILQPQSPSGQTCVTAAHISVCSKNLESTIPLHCPMESFFNWERKKITALFKNFIFYYQEASFKAEKKALQNWRTRANKGESHKWKFSGICWTLPRKLRKNERWALLHSACFYSSRVNTIRAGIDTFGDFVLLVTYLNWNCYSLRCGLPLSAQVLQLSRARTNSDIWLWHVTFQ